MDKNKQTQLAAEVWYIICVTMKSLLNPQIFTAVLYTALIIMYINDQALDMFMLGYLLREMSDFECSLMSYHYDTMRFDFFKPKICTYMFGNNICNITFRIRVKEPGRCVGENSHHKLKKTMKREGFCKW